jgi:hypothetical protein
MLVSPHPPPAGLPDRVRAVGSEAEHEPSRASVLITAQEVVLGTAARMPLAHKRFPRRLADALHRVLVASMSHPFPAPHRYPRHYGYLESARMVREMDRL